MKGIDVKYPQAHTHTHTQIFLVFFPRPELNPTAFNGKLLWALKALIPVSSGILVAWLTQIVSEPFNNVASSCSLTQGRELLIIFPM